MDKKEIKRILKSIWHFLWESNSIWSWIACIILSFILIKFVVYPVIGLILSTSHPVVAVVSGSMEHEGSFDEWWNSVACEDGGCTQAKYYAKFNIKKEDFLKFRYKDGFNKGDIMILVGANPEKISIGDVIVFRNRRPDPIIHRVVKKWEKDNEAYFQTKGDHNSHSYAEFEETSISQDRVIGKAVIRVPYLGWIKIAAVKLWLIIQPR